jgi:hypothetical protein
MRSGVKAALFIETLPVRLFMAANLTHRSAIAALFWRLFRYAGL